MYLMYRFANVYMPLFIYNALLLYIVVSMNSLIWFSVPILV